MYDYKKLIILFIVLLLSLTVLTATQTTLAALPGPPAIGGLAGGLLSFQNLIVNILNLVWYIFIAVSVIMFVVAGIQFLTAQGEPSKINTARQSVIWGTAGIVVALIAFSAVVMIKAILGIP